jgi:hypothetical protein
MLSLLIAFTLAQTQPAVRRSTPLSDDPGMVVRQTGTLNINCLSGCSNVVYQPDGGPLGSVTQGTQPWLVAGADGGAVQVSGSISATNPSVGSTGAAVPTSATLIGGTNGTNLLAPYVITTTPDAGDPGLVVRVVGGISGGGSGGAVTQGSTPWLVASSDAGILPVTVENTVTVTGTVNAAQSGTWNVNNVSGTVSLPTGASTSALQTTGNTSLSNIDTKTPALGQTTMVGSTPVVIASNQTAVPVSGTVTANAGTGTFAVSAASLPLPTGAATAANQTTINTQTTKLNDGTDTALITGSGALVVDGSGSTQPVSGTVTANAGTGTFAVSAAALPLPTGASTAANQTTLGSQTTKINDGTDTALVSAAGALIVDGSAVTQPVSGTVTTTPPANATTNVTQFGGTNVSTGTGTGGAGIPRVTVSSDSTVGVTGTVTVSGTVTANAGTNLNTSALALDATLGRTQGSATAAQTGPIVQGAATAAAPTYTTATTNPLSLTTAGALRTDSSATTQPVSGTVTANAGTGNFTVVQSTAASLRAQTSAEGATGSAVPANANLSGFRDGSGNLRAGFAIDQDTSGSTVYVQGSAIVGAQFGSPLAASVEASAMPGTNSGLGVRPILKTATSVLSTSVTCATSATAAPASVLANRHSICIYNNGANTIFIGPTGVTTSNGFPLPAGGSFCDDVNTTQVYSCIVASGTENARVIEN